MRTLSKSKLCGILVMQVLLVMLMVGASFADVTDGYPGYPNAWEGMTTNTIIRIDLDRSVAMSDGQPDMDYAVKKAAFDGFDFITTEVVCDVEVSDDLKTIRLYPQGLLEKDSFYAYKLERIAFADGTEQEYIQCYATGSNPAQFLNTLVSEIDMCDDSSSDLAWASWCGKCHEEWESYFPCVLTPND
jgi:hypothetical protein